MFNKLSLFKSKNNVNLSFFNFLTKLSFIIKEKMQKIIAYALYPFGWLCTRFDAFVHGRFSGFCPEVPDNTGLEKKTIFFFVFIFINILNTSFIQTLFVNEARQRRPRWQTIRARRFTSIISCFRALFDFCLKTMIFTLVFLFLFSFHTPLRPYIIDIVYCTRVQYPQWIGKNRI